MSDGISGIKIITPSYPVKPVQPAQKDRESGKRERDPPASESDSDHEDNDKPVIDEYI
jgi:hypothetical protein